MVLEGVADVRGEGVQFVIGQVGPNDPREAAGAEVAEGRARKLKVLERLCQYVHVEWGIVRDDEVCGQKQ